MSEAAIAALLTLIAEAVKALPAIITDIEDLIRNAKATVSGGDPDTSPVAPKVEADNAELVDELKGQA